MRNHESKTFNQIYMEKSNQIYTEKQTNELITKEKEVIQCQKMFLNFLQNNLSPVKYQRATQYLNLFSEKKNDMATLWYKQFYFGGLEDCDKIEIKFIQNSKYRNLTKALLIFIIKQMKQLNNFAEQINDLEGMFEIIVGIRTEVLPINDISKILQLDISSGEDEEFEDKIRDIIRNENNDHYIEKSVEKLFNKYNL